MYLLQPAIFWRCFPQKFNFDYKKKKKKKKKTIFAKSVSVDLGFL